MKKIFFAVVFLFTLNIHSSNAQAVQAGINMGLQVPVGDFATWYNPGFGAGAYGKYFLKENMALGANLNFNSFRGDRYHDPYYNNDWRDNASITAFTGLFQYYFSGNKLKPYAGADLGFYFWRLKSYNNYYYWTNPAGHPVYNYYTNNGTAFGIAPAGGITYDITDKLVFDVNLKFNLILTESGLNHLGLNFGLLYKIKE
jgi:hypothetical protein